MKVQRVQPIVTVDIDTYRRIKAEVEEHQPDAEEWFIRMDKLLGRVWPWIMALATIYLAAQMFRALINGGLPL